MWIVHSVDTEWLLSTLFDASLLLLSRLSRRLFFLAAPNKRYIALRGAPETIS